jgi:UDP-N-acetylmuramoylalanine--D-glutamate ligase
MFSPEVRPLDWYCGRKVTVMGLGLFGGGRGITEFLCSLGARVTVTDLRSEEKLLPTIEALRRLPPSCTQPRWVLGRHEESDFLGADLVVPNPAVPRTAPLLCACLSRGVPLDTEMNLFFKHCPGRICAVTGSNGKTTTTHLAAAMAQRRWPGVLMGGNVGRSLLPELHEIRRGDWVVLELSSFQLEDLRDLDRRPEVSVVTNLSVNHLDRHGSYAEYLAAKREVLRPGPAPNVAVLNGDDAELLSWSRSCPREVQLFQSRAVSSDPPRGALLDPEARCVFDCRDGGRRVLFHRSDLRLRGRHNVANAAAAALAALAMGIAPDEVVAALRDFRGVEHRLELVATVGGVEYFNDSIATTPESTIAALDAFLDPLEARAVSGAPRPAGLCGGTILILGGSDKGCAFDELGRAVSRGASRAILLGQTAEAIEAAIRAAGRPPPLHRVRDLAEAVAVARKHAVAGDRVVLSPSCPSYDQFVNFEERGRRFKELVGESRQSTVDS